jgi:hypothetical protein
MLFEEQHRAMRPTDRYEAAPRELPEDVQRRYDELQAEIRQLEISREAREGESREERYARQQRLRYYRRELDRVSRYPLARRQRANATAIGAIVVVALVLCVVSFAGGALITGILNRPADITSVATPFWNDMTIQDYADAHNYLDPQSGNVQDFTAEATQADKDMGTIDKVVSPPTPRLGSNVSFTSATYVVYRTGTYNGQPTKFKANKYNITLNFNYNPNGGLGSNAWTIIGVGNLFIDPSS